MILCVSASTISDGVMPKDISRGTSKGSLNNAGEIHRKLWFVRTLLAVAADIYLK